MRKMKVLAVIAAVSAAVAIEAGAATTPFELSLFGSPLSIPWCDDVSGFRLDLFAGSNRNVSGLDIGTLANLVDERAAGLQLCGFYNRIGSGVGNLQVAGLLNRCEEDYKGLQLTSVYNEVGGTLTGGSLAVMNQAKETHGFQLGVCNTTDTLVGMQIGLVNYAEATDKGVQVGLINVMPEARIPVNVIVNIGF